VEKDIRCVSCHRIIKGDSRLVCGECQAEVEVNFSELTGERGLYATLIKMGAAALQSSSTQHSEISVRRVEAPTPLNFNAMSVVTKGGAMTTVQGWAQDWSAHRAVKPPEWSGPEITSRGPDGKVIRGQFDLAIESLRSNLPWATETRRDFGNFKRDLHHITQDCKRVIDPGDPAGHGAPKIPLGKCPTITIGVGLCQHPLSVRVGALSIRCPKCGTTWPMLMWPILARGMAG
jgi:hypothetical protein